MSLGYIYDGMVRLDPTAIAQVPHALGLGRYVTGGNGLNVPETQAIFAAGLGVLPIFETAADEAEHPERGAGDAVTFNRLLDAIGAPAGITVAMTDDHNDADTSQERAYWAAAHPIIAAEGRLLACYSGGNTVSQVMADGNAEVGWMVESWTQWGGAPDAQLIQEANSKDPQPPGMDRGSYDVNLVMRAFPLWGSEDDMAISDEQMNTLGKWMQDQREVMLNVLIGDHDAAKDRGVLAGWDNDTRNMILTALSGVKGTSAPAQVDPVALATALATALGPDIAKKLADELATRLQH